MMQHDTTSSRYPHEAVTTAEAMDEFTRPYLLAARTSVPCPDWCEAPQPHGFMPNGLGEQHTRSHRLTVDVAADRTEQVEDLDVTIHVEEQRDGTDDSTVRRTGARLVVNIDGEFSADDTRKIAAALLTASHKMREIEQQ